MTNGIRIREDDRNVLDVVLGMKHSTNVLNFNGNTFGDFFEDEVGIDIYSRKYFKVQPIIFQSKLKDGQVQK